MAALLPGAPVRNPLAVRQGYVAPIWETWLRTLWNALNRTPQVLVSQTWTAQAVRIATTTVLVAPVTGLYRLSYVVRVTQAATTSSSLQVTLGWTDGGQALTMLGESLIGNTVTTSETLSVLVRADAKTALTVAASYSSGGTTPMQFGLSVVAEALP